MGNGIKAYNTYIAPQAATAAALERIAYRL